MVRTRWGLRWFALVASGVGLSGLACGGDNAPAATPPDGGEPVLHEGPRGPEADGGADVSIGPTLVASDDGATVKGTTNGLDDVVLGPIEVAGATYTLRVPAVAVGPGIELSMTPLKVQGSPLPVLGAFRFAPGGTTFRVPAVLTVEGLAPGAKASTLVADDGRNAAFTFVQEDKGVTRVSVPHFSVAAIVDAAKADAQVGAAGIASLPLADSDVLLAAAFQSTVGPAVDQAGDSIVTFAKAGVLLEQWMGAVQGRDVGAKAPASLGGRTLGALANEAVDAMVAKGKKLLGDLQKKTCKDGSGQLNHPHEWFSALAYMTSQVNRYGGASAVPTEYAPCLTVELDPAVLSQGGVVPMTQRAVPVSLGLLAVSPSGLKAPMRGSYTLAVSGGTAPDFVDPPSPALFPVDIDRGAQCGTRSTSPVTVKITGALRGTLELANLLVTPATSPALTWTVTGDASSCPPPATVELLSREGEVALAAVSRHRPLQVSPVQATSEEVFSSIDRNEFNASVLSLSVFKPFLGTLSNAKGFAVPGDTGTVSAGASSGSETVSVNGAGLFLGGSVSGSSTCSIAFDRPVVPPCQSQLFASSACADALVTGRYGHNMSFVLRQSRRILYSGNMTAAGRTGGSVPGESSRARVELRGAGFNEDIQLVGGDSSDAPRTEPFTRNIVLAAGQYTLATSATSFCSDYTASPTTGSRNHPASVSMTVAFADP